MNKFITLTVACFALFVQADAASNKATVEKLYDLYENGTAREFADTYASLVAEDFDRWLGRYVGLGFRMNDDEMTVAEVVNSPAKDHLKPVDKILSVNGIKARTPSLIGWLKESRPDVAVSYTHLTLPTNREV